MTRRKKYWIFGIAASLAVIIICAYIAASILARPFEPMVREQAIRYLRERFHSDV